MPDNIKITGLKELRKELRKLDETGLVQELKDVNYDVAQRVVDKARSQAAGQGRMQAAAAATLKPGKQAARAVVTGGGAKAPFFGGAEFGSQHDQPRTTARGSVTGWNQFEPWKGNGSNAGYFLYEAIRDLTAEIVDLYGDALEKIAGRAFPD